MWFEKCDRCQKGDENRYKGARRATRIIFIGGFHAIICPECENDWHLRMDDDEDYQALRRLEIECACAVQATDYDESVRFAEMGRDCGKQLFTKAERFVAEEVTHEKVGNGV